MKRILVYMLLMLVGTFIFVGLLKAELRTSISGSVVDEKTGIGVEGVTVYAESLGSGGKTITNSKGQFVLSGLTSGKYKLRFEKLDSEYIIPGKPQMEITLQDGKNIVNVNHVMMIGSVVIGKINKVEDINKLSKSTVGYEIQNPVPTWANKIGTVDVNSSGEFIIRGLPQSGNLALGVSVPGYLSVDKYVQISKGENRVPIDIVPANNNYIQGTVMTSKNKPIADVRILIIQNNEALAQAVTDSFGKYSVVGISPGTYTVTMFSDTIGAVSKEVVVQENKVTECSFIINTVEESHLTFGMVLNWCMSLLATDAYAAAIKTVPIFGKVKAVIAGYNYSCANRIKELQAAYSQTGSIVNDDANCMGAKLRKSLKEKITSGGIFVICTNDESECENIITDEGCAITYSSKSTYCPSAFNNICGCFEAVAFHETIHTVQTINFYFGEELAYVCEKLFFPVCSKIPGNYIINNAKKTCELNFLGW